MSDASHLWVLIIRALVLVMLGLNLYLRQVPEGVLGVVL